MRKVTALAINRNLHIA